MLRNRPVLNTKTGRFIETELTPTNSDAQQTTIYKGAIETELISTDSDGKTTSIHIGYVGHNMDKNTWLFAFEDQGFTQLEDGSYVLPDVELMEKGAPFIDSPEIPGLATKSYEDGRVEAMLFRIHKSTSYGHMPAMSPWGIMGQNRHPVHSLAEKIGLIDRPFTEKDMLGLRGFRKIK